MQGDGRRRVLVVRREIGGPVGRNITSHITPLSSSRGNVDGPRSTSARIAPANQRRSSERC